MMFMMLQILEEISENLAENFLQNTFVGCLLSLDDSLQGNDDELRIIAYVDRLL